MKFIDRHEARDKLEAFKRVLRDRHTVDTFVDEKDLAAKIKRDLAGHLASRTGAVEDPDEVSAARSILEQFALLPKSVAGKEVRLSLLVTDTPYPASRMVCQAFNLEFGATIGVPVKITQPSGVALRDLSGLFVDSKHAVKMLPLKKGDRVDAYARLHFSDNELDQLQARYRTRTDYKNSLFATSAVADLLGDPIRYPADSSIAAELSKLIRIERSLENDA